MNQRHKNGFTLIELLVVIAIISLLVSILLPSLQKAKELARRAVCMTQLKNMGSAIYMYANNYNGTLPGPSGAGMGFNYFRWTYSVGLQWYLIPYMTDTWNNENYWETNSGYMDILLCPSHPHPQDVEFKQHYVAHTGEDVFGYMANSLSCRPGGANYRPPANISTINNPADTWAIEDADYFNYPNEAFQLVTPYPVHNDGRNVLWIDSHVSWLEPELTPGVHP